MEKSGIIIEMGRSHWVRPDKDGAATRSVERRRSRKVAALSRLLRPHHSEECSILALRSLGEFPYAPG